MNVFTQLLNISINFLFAPFTNQNNLSLINEIPLAAINILKTNVGLQPCRSTLFKMGENELKISLTPRGRCLHCCAMKPVRFLLYNKRNRPKRGIAISQMKAGMAFKAGINNTWPTEIFVHGFSEPSPGQSGQEVVNAYLSRKDRNFNVILLDWSELSTFPWYWNSVENVNFAAEKLKNFLEIFHDSGEIPIGNVHVIGFSLGSHIASFAGKLLRQDLRIPRITALDPAFPNYALQDSTRRLTPSDAEYIDVIHTDSGILGFPLSVGHADFYPNGGRALQPGCQPSYLVRIRLIDQILGCSHVRAWRLYAESVRNFKAFPATKCPIWRGFTKQCNFTQDAFMGYNNNRQTKGQYYLITNHKAPYSKNEQQQMN